MADLEEQRVGEILANEAVVVRSHLRHCDHVKSRDETLMSRELCQEIRQMPPPPAISHGLPPEPSRRTLLLGELDILLGVEVVLVEKLHPSFHLLVHLRLELGVCVQGEGEGE